MPLPATFPWPIVIAQHMPASFTGPLSSRLDRICAIKVTEVTASTVLEPGYAYIGRGDGDVVVSRRGLGLLAGYQSLPHPKITRGNPSTDLLVAAP